MILQITRLPQRSRSSCSGLQTIPSMSEYSSYTPGTPLTLTLCLEEDSILLSEAVLEALGHPRQVQMLINQGCLPVRAGDI